MAQNNIVTLTGNLGSEARIIASKETTFASVSIATTDSYKDDQGQWQNKDIIWHSLLAFKPRIIEQLKSLKTGTRIQIIGSLSYRPFDVLTGDGEAITKKEAAIIISKLEIMPLVRKTRKAVENA